MAAQQNVATPIPAENQDQANFVQIDESLVVHLLSLSHEQRIDAHEMARELTRDLMQAGKEYYARQSQVPT